jgi:hypothetical protein
LLIRQCVFVTAGHGLPLTGGSYETHNHHRDGDCCRLPRSMWLGDGTNYLSHSFAHCRRDTKRIAHCNAVTVGKPFDQREPLAKSD